MAGMERRSFPIKLFTGNAHPELANKVKDLMGLPLTDMEVKNFANGETRVEIKENCRGCDAFVIQPICNAEDGKRTVNDILMELLVIVSALKGSSAARITAVMPIYGYARQDKKDKSRAAISARLVADLLEVAGINRAVSVDLHASQIQGFFSRPMDNLYAEDWITGHMMDKFKHMLPAPAGDCKEGSGQIVIVAPDAGGAKRASRVASKLGVDCAIISKERLRANEVSSMRLVGVVKDKVAIIVDDMADTCGTLCMAADLLRSNGSTGVHAYVVHGVLSGNAIEKLNKCESLTSLVTTNSIPQNKNQKACPKLHVVDISTLLAGAITCIHTDKSVSALFSSPVFKAQAHPQQQPTPLSLNASS